MMPPSSIKNEEEVNYPEEVSLGLLSSLDFFPLMGDLNKNIESLPKAASSLYFHVKLTSKSQTKFLAISPALI